MFDIKIWLVKWAKKLVLVLLASGMLYTSNEIQITEFPTEYAFWAGLLMTVLSQTGNYIKHSYLE